jgi:hypothetical protein
LDFDFDLATAQKLMSGWKTRNLMAQFLESLLKVPESALADTLLQPVEYSYTIESFESLVASCNLEMLTPCLNQYDKVTTSVSWNLEFNDSSLQNYYDCLSDLQRWQITNLLMLEQSPLIWFYLQRKDSGRTRKSDRQLCNEFLSLRFKKNVTQKKIYLKTNKGKYVLSPHLYPHPSMHAEDMCQMILAAVENHTSKTIGEIIEQLVINPSFSLVNMLRLYLTTIAYPYLSVEN